jgi:hypothetical protein
MRAKARYQPHFRIKNLLPKKSSARTSFLKIVLSFLPPPHLALRYAQRVKIFLKTPLVYFLSRWPELNRRPTPSFTPLLRPYITLYERIRLYLKHFSFERMLPLSVVRAPERYGLDPAGSLTVIRDSRKDFSLCGQGAYAPPWSCSTS